MNMIQDTSPSTFSINENSTLSKTPRSKTLVTTGKGSVRKSSNSAVMMKPRAPDFSGTAAHWIEPMMPMTLRAMRAISSTKFSAPNRIGRTVPSSSAAPSPLSLGPRKMIWHNDKSKLMSKRICLA